MIHFTVPGIPRPQGSKSVSRTGRMYEASKYIKGWRESVSIEARRAALDAPKTQASGSVTINGQKRQVRRYVVFMGAVVVEARFFMKRPQRGVQGYHTSKPDLDKLQRAIGDALTAADVLGDDSQIVSWPAHPGKQYAAEGEEPRVEITVCSADDYESQLKRGEE